jgi:signal transduction histidine kinase
LLVSSIPEIGPGGKVTQVIATFYDISEIRKNEAEIKRLNYELRELTKHLQDTWMNKENKLAIKIHDQLGQKLVGLKFEADFIKQNLTAEQNLLTERAKYLSHELNSMLHDFSTLYNEINPTLIENPYIWLY